jgi:hypothetical protein
MGTAHQGTARLGAAAGFRTAETRMTSVVDELELTELVTPIRGLSAVGVAVQIRVEARTHLRRICG